MEDEFDSEKFTKTLNTLGTHQSMVDQMLYQALWTVPGCPYYEHVAHKLMDLKVSLITMNTIYANLYEQYKETQPNG